MNPLHQNLRAQGRYFDGQSAHAREIAIEVTADGLIIGLDPAEFWPQGGFRVEVSPDRTHVRLCKVADDGVSIFVEGEGFAAAFAPRGSIAGLAGHERFPTVFWALGLTIVAAGGVYWAYPRITAEVAAAMPIRVERALGVAVWNGLAPVAERIDDRTVDAHLAGMLRRLVPAQETAYRFEIAVAKEWRVNAWAAPGGYLGVHRGLICNMRSGDELAAVLAHEISHVFARHGTRNLVRTLGLRFGLSLISGGGDPTLDSAAMLSSLQYMRDDEESADQGALELLVRAKVNPQALAGAFEQLEKSAPDVPQALRYLSSHPPIAQRRDLARRAAWRLTGETAPMMTLHEWQQFRTACGCPPVEDRLTPAPVL